VDLLRIAMILSPSVKANRVTPGLASPGRPAGLSAAWATPVVLFAVLMLFGSTPTPVLAQHTTSGTMHVVWDGDVPAAYYVVDPTGTGRQLLIDDAEAAVARYFSLDRQPVELTGSRIVPGGAGPGVDGLRTTGVRAMTRMGVDVAGMVEDSRDFVTLLCRFADEPEPFARENIAEVHGASYPGVRQYFAELAWDQALMAGSRVTDWYVLPKPRDAYVFQNLTDFGALARDCTAAADEDVDFAAFYGINLQFSGALSRRLVQPYDVLSFGGSWTLSLDGVTRSWGMTWLSAGHATTRAVVMHEMGHALGWPHSSGGAGNTYDSNWDVMSRGYLRWEPPHGWLTVHTIAQHKDAVGWVASHRRWVPVDGSLERGMIVRTALPPEDGYLFARVPSGDSDYTVEVRRQAGHDQPLPGDAVVIHRVRFGMASVVTADGQSDPNGAGAQWLPGEEYHDQERGVSVRVDAVASDGFHVSITRGWRADIAADGPGRIIARGVDASSSCDSACSLVVSERGARVQLEPAPEMAATFSHWTGDCAAYGTVCELSLNRNHTATAVFRAGVAVGETLLAATVGDMFEAELHPRGPATSAEWRILGGDLPEGMQFDAEALVIRGIAIEAGTFVITIAPATDEAGLVERYRLDVAPPALTASVVVDQLLGANALRPVDIQYLDRAGNRNGRLDIGDVRQWVLEQVRAGAIATREARVLQQFVGAVR